MNGAVIDLRRIDSLVPTGIIVNQRKHYSSKETMTVFELNCGFSNKFFYGSEYFAYPKLNMIQYIFLFLLVNFSTLQWCISRRKYTVEDT